MTMKIESTTDSAEMVQAALGQKKESEAPKMDAEKKNEDSDPSVKSLEKPDSEASIDAVESDEPEDGDGNEEADLERESRPKKKSGFKRRIEKLSRRISEQEMEIQRLRSSKDVETIPNKNTKHEPKDGSSIDRPKADDFDSHEDFVEALTEWKLERKLLEKDEKNKMEKLKDEEIQAREDFARRCAKVSEKIKDFDSVIESVDDVSLSPVLENILLQSENGPELMYQLAMDRDEYERINSLGYTAALREIGKFEGRQSKQETKEKKAVSKAPPPLKPLGSQTQSAIAEDPEKMDFKQFKIWREKKEKERFLG